MQQHQNRLCLLLHPCWSHPYLPRRHNGRISNASYRNILKALHDILLTGEMRDAASTVVGDVPPALRSARVGNDILWGRTTQVTWINYSAALLVLIAPMGLYMNWLALEHFDGSLLLAIQTLSFRGLGLIWQFHPRPTILACLGYIVWLAWQGVLYRYLPRRKCFGSRTPGGYILQYTTNGFAAWVITHVLFLAGAVMGLIDPAIIASNWDG